VLGERFAGLRPEPVDDIDDAGRDLVLDQLEPLHDGDRRLLGRFDHDAVAGGEGGRQLPRRHQEREVPRDDLAHDAERLVEVDRDGVLVELRDAALLRPDDAGEVAEVVDDEREVGRERLPDRLPVVDGVDEGEVLQVGLGDVGDPVEHVGPVRHRRVPPRLVERLLRRGHGVVDVHLGRAGDLGKVLPVDGGRVVEVLPVDGLDELAADVVEVALLELRAVVHHEGKGRRWRTGPA
jgi:ParB family chromosome partitioning protein